MNERINDLINNISENVHNITMMNLPIEELKQVTKIASEIQSDLIKIEKIVLEEGIGQPPII